MSRRTIVQVSGFSYGSKVGTVALCNDGTVWSICGPGDQWHRFPEIPPTEGPERPPEADEPVVMEAGSPPPPAKTVGVQKAAE